MDLATQKPCSNNIATLYCDGGTISDGGDAGSSSLGGVWAYVGVDPNGMPVKTVSGIVTPPYCDINRVTSNVMELIAVNAALTAMPDGWDGELYTDSLITLQRVFHLNCVNGQLTPVKSAGVKMEGVPEWLLRLTLVNKKRMWNRTICVDARLVAGHPEASDLRRGYKLDGRHNLPVSVWNVYCDDRCNEIKALHRQGINDGYLIDQLG